MFDQMKCKIFHSLWRIWHSHLSRFFDYVDAKLHGKDQSEWMYGVRGVSGPRPMWHLCCNGNSGGWRTGVCDFLERNFRETKHYNS